MSRRTRRRQTLRTEDPKIRSCGSRPPSARAARRWLSL